MMEGIAQDVEWSTQLDAGCEPRLGAQRHQGGVNP